MADSSGTHASAYERGNGNGKRWYGAGNVVRVLFYMVFAGIVGWGTYVWTRTEQAHTKIDNVKTETVSEISGVKAVNTLQDERISRINEDLREIKADQKEILRRIPR